MNPNNLKDCLTKFWTPKKCGKSGEPEDFIEQHDMILGRTLIADPADLLEQLEENIFNFQKFDMIEWSDFLRRANLAEYLKSDYIRLALDVTTTRPAIGKGEFLFVSCFSNLGFANGKGDIVDFKSGKRCEFKGIRSTLSGDSRVYRQMNKSIIYSIFSLFGTGSSYDHFNRKCAEDIDELLKSKPGLINEVLKRLQNLTEPDLSFIRPFAELYEIKKDIFTVVGAMQFCIYLKIQNSQYILFTNDEGFKCFEQPRNADEAYHIVNGLKLSSWQTGDYGMTIGM